MEEFVCIPAIVAICYMIIEVIKLCTKNQIVTKLFPAISCTIGIILGIVSFYACPALIAANNILTAILIGGSSGLSATGANQIVKQLIQKNYQKTDDDTSTDESQKTE